MRGDADNWKAIGLYARAFSGSNPFDNIIAHLHLKEVTMGCGTPERIRTSDARFRKPTLYPLSYESIYAQAR